MSMLTKTEQEAVRRQLTEDPTIIADLLDHLTQLDLGEELQDDEEPFAA